MQPYQKMFLSMQPLVPVYILYILLDSLRIVYYDISYRNWYNVVLLIAPIHDANSHEDAHQVQNKIVDFLQIPPAHVKIQRIDPSMI